MVYMSDTLFEVMGTGIYVKTIPGHCNDLLDIWVSKWLKAEQSIAIKWFGQRMSDPKFCNWLGNYKSPNNKSK